MKKIVAVLAVAGLLGLAACKKTPPLEDPSNVNSIENGGENFEDIAAATNGFNATAADAESNKL